MNNSKEDTNDKDDKLITPRRDQLVNGSNDEKDFNKQTKRALTLNIADRIKLNTISKFYSWINRMIKIAATAYPSKKQSSQKNKKPHP